MLRHIYLLVIFLTLSSAAFCAEGEFTFEIQGTRIANGETFTGHGTAVGLDLTAYGRPGKRYLLTCAHVIDGYTDHNIVVGTEKWSCKVVWKDDELDLCVVSCEKDLPALADLGSADLNVDDRFTTQGYPNGKRSDIVKGTVTAKAGILREAKIAGFAHGCSGSGIFSSGKLVGIAIGFAASSIGTEIQDKAYFVPVKRIKMFLLYNAIHKE